MIIRILKSYLKGIVVYVAHGKFRTNLWNIQSFEFQAHQGPRGIRIEGLINAQSHLIALLQNSIDKMFFKYFQSYTLFQILHSIPTPHILSNRITFYLQANSIIPLLRLSRGSTF